MTILHRRSVVFLILVLQIPLVLVLRQIAPAADPMPVFRLITDSFGDVMEGTTRVRHDGATRNVFEARDIYAMGGDDLDVSPYIEHSDDRASGAVQGVNFMVPDGSRWGWRFFTRKNEHDLTLRARFDQFGNATFAGTAQAPSFIAGVAGKANNGFAWGNTLGGDSLTRIEAAPATRVAGVEGSVFAVSYADAAVVAQNGYGDLGIARNLFASGVVTQSVMLDNVSISAGHDSPPQHCTAGDLYAHAGGGPSLYTCVKADTWAAVLTGKPDAP